MAWGWTQGQLGMALNTDQTAVSAWELDKARPSGAALAALSNLFGLPVEALEGDGVLTSVPEPPAKGLAGPRSVTLPAFGGTGAAVDLKTQQAFPLQDAQEGILRLIEAGRQGRRFWIVLE